MTTSRPLTGRAVLVWLLGFFGLVFIVNGVFIYYAERSFPGLSADNAYEAGLDYNRVLESADAQRLLGWQVVVNVDAQTKSLVLTIGDAANLPIEVLTATAELRRPAESVDDRHLDFVRVGPGLYRAAAEILTSGIWDATIRIHRNEQDDYILQQRLSVP